MSSIALPRDWRFEVHNGFASAAINAANAVITGRRVKRASDGSLTFEGSEATIYSNSAQITAGNSLAEDNVDNSTDEYEGGDFILKITPSASATGVVSVFLQVSTDGGTVWSTERTQPVARAVFAATSAQKLVFFEL